jgi:RNA polymerase sigma-70 factor (ECF subfamily)
MEQADEKAWIEQAKKGEEAGFSRLVALHQKSVYAFTLGMVRDPATADELTQTTFLKAWKALPQFRSESTFRTWLFQIAVNNVRSWGRWQKIRWFREKSLDAAVESEEGEAQGYSEHHADLRADADPGRQSETAELSQKLQKAIERLPPQEKAVFILRHVQDVSTKEVADVLKIAEGSVKAHLSHALEKLRKTLEEPTE